MSAREYVERHSVAVECEFCHQMREPHLFRGQACNRCGAVAS
jgi:Zn finger protein HypA/HybF involved in hydrogenase expression